jgi:protein-S-isoprenylcysteine O-methyltransferase Ste14
MGDLARQPAPRRVRIAEALARRGAGAGEVLARRRVPLGFVVAVATLVLAEPTWRTWQIGFAVALVGEIIRIWAAGHLEKGREVTRSGPYRWTRHPLYVGSSVIALGVVIASRSAAVALLAAAYMGSTLTAAIRVEEAFLRSAFGPAYDDYTAARAAPVARRLSWARVRANREYRSVTGLVIGFALLALKLMIR